MSTDTTLAWTMLSPQLLKLGLHSVYTVFLQNLVLVVEDWLLGTNNPEDYLQFIRNKPAWKIFGICTIPRIPSTSESVIQIRWPQKDVRRNYQSPNIGDAWQILILAPAFLSPSPSKISDPHPKPKHERSVEKSRIMCGISRQIWVTPSMRDSSPSPSTNSEVRTRLRPRVRTFEETRYYLAWILVIGNGDTWLILVLDANAGDAIHGVMRAKDGAIEPRTASLTLPFSWRSVY